MDRARAINELSAITQVRADDDGTVPETYLTGGRGEHGAALAVVAPQSTEEVQAIIRYAIDHKLRIVPQGARTGLVGGTVPEEKDADTTIILSLERFKQRCDYSAADERIVVDAGYSLSEVNEFLKPFGVCVAIDVSSDPLVGGMAATNIAGSRVVRYGDFRDLCVGIEVVLADQATSIYSSINRPRKSNSQLNFTELFVGSFGKLGIITSVALSVHPIVEKTQTAWLPVNDGVDLSELLSFIKKESGEALLACEFISAEALRALAESDSQKQSRITVPYKHDGLDVIFVEWGSALPGFDVDLFMERVLTTMLDKGLIDDATDVEPAKTWDLRHRLSEAVQHSGAKLIGCDVSAMCDRVGDLRSLAREAVDAIDPRLEVCDFGHLGDGGFHMNVVVHDEVYEEWLAAGFADEKAYEVRLAVSEVADSLGGSFSAEHGLGAFNAKIAEKLGDPTIRRISEEVVRVFNPFNVLGHEGIQL